MVKLVRKQDYDCKDQNGDFPLGRKVRMNAEDSLGNVFFLKLGVVYVYICFILIL